MAARHIHCLFCTPEKDWHIPANWSADYAMTWFYNDHVQGDHGAELIAGLTTLLKQHTPVCRPCRAHNALRRPDHRPCFEASCYCSCSRTTPTTTAERTADADG